MVDMDERVMWENGVGSNLVRCFLSLAVIGGCFSVFGTSCDASFKETSYLWWSFFESPIVEWFACWEYWVTVVLSVLFGMIGVLAFLPCCSVSVSLYLR